jgi:hypothetical protein
MTAWFPNAAPRPRKAVRRFSPSRDRDGMWKLSGAAVAAWLKTTYRPVLQENPTPALVFAICFLAVMFGMLFLFL